MWTLDDAVIFARDVERNLARDLVEPLGHVALTGGCLYKDGARKDLDLLFYGHSKHKNMSKPTILDRLKEDFKLEIVKDMGRVCKVTYALKPVDLFFEGMDWCSGHEYGEDEEKQKEYDRQRQQKQQKQKVDYDFARILREMERANNREKTEELHQLHGARIIGVTSSGKIVGDGC